MKNILIVIILTSVLLSCKTSTEQKNVKYVEEIKLVAEKKIPDAIFYNWGISEKNKFPYKIDDCKTFEYKNKLLFFNINNFDLLISDYHTNKILYSIKLPQKKNLGTDYRLYIRCIDSIYAFSHFQRRLVLLDTINVKKVYDFYDSKDIKYFTRLTPNMFYVIDDFLYVNKLYNRNNDNSNKLLYKINLSNRQIDEVYKNKVDFIFDLRYFYNYMYNFLKLDGSNTFIYSYFYSEDLYFYDYEKDKITKKIKAKSKYLDSIQVPPRNVSKNWKQKQFTLNTNSYYKIYYDKYNKRYYRFTKIIFKNEKLNNEEINLINSNLIHKASIIILDEDFNTVGETLIDNFCYDFHHVFINKYGLHILNVNKTMEEENQLVFDIFKPEKIE